MKVSAMACKTGDFRAPAKVFLVDGRRHPNHHSRNFFSRGVDLAGRFIRKPAWPHVVAGLSHIRIELRIGANLRVARFDVTIGACNPKRRPEESHSDKHLFRRLAFKYLDILINVFHLRPTHIRLRCNRLATDCPEEHGGKRHDRTRSRTLQSA